MSSPRLLEIKRLFLAVHALPVDERAAHLDSECGDDQDLRHAVESLLDQPDRMTLLREPERLRALAESLLDAGVTPASPEIIGPYRILGVLGSGGMGVVYRAEQQGPLRRFVALKLVRGGFGSHDVMARFESERKTLALMNHPNVAHVLDAGTDSTGQPYFVMDLVDGIAINEFVEREHLSLRDRVLLYQAACRGVQHAHQKGIIHRDLKPSNVLVSMVDGIPMPRIIDFGIAKAVGDAQRSVTLTHAGQLVGTLEYMSPEQASGGSDALDTRADIYSLGVVLYELITGELPYETRSLPLADALTAIVRSPPRRFRTTTAGRKHFDPDLETITFKALDKDPDRRYASVGDLIADLDRYLRSEPIAARPPSALYQLRKLASRHRLPVAFATALLVLLVVFALAQRQERARAEAQARKATAVSEFLESMLASADPGAVGRKLTLEEVLDLTAQDLDTRFASDPEVLASLHNTIGEANRALARYPQAAHHLQRGLDIRSQLFSEPHPDIADSKLNVAAFHAAQNINSAGLSRADSLARESLAMNVRMHGREHTEVAVSLALLADIAQTRAQYAISESLYNEALEITTVVHGKNANEAATILGELVYPLSSQGRLVEAAAAAREALRILTINLGPRHTRVSAAQQNLAYVLEKQAAYTAAESLYLDAIAIESGIRGADHPAVADRLSKLGALYMATDRLAEATVVLRRALEIKRAAMGDSSFALAVDYNSLAICLDKQGDKDALPMFDRALQLYRANLGDGHPQVLTLRGNMAVAALTSGREEETVEIAKQVLARRIETLGANNINTGVSHFVLGTALMRLGRFEEAREHNQRTLDCWVPTWGEQHPNVALAHANVAYEHHAAGRLDEAEATCRAALEVQKAALSGDHPATGPVRAQLGRVLADRGKLREARVELERAVAVIAATTPNHHQVGEAQSSLADVALELGDALTAEVNARAAATLLARVFPPQHPRLALAIVTAVQASRALGRSVPVPADVVAIVRSNPGILPGEKHRMLQRRESLVPGPVAVPSSADRGS
jgi:serine/threonine protein kinase